MIDVKIKGIYRHFKGGEYKVLEIARNSNDPKKLMVIYETLYHGEYPIGTVWVRPLDEFTGYKDGVPRFELLE